MADPFATGLATLRASAGTVAGDYVAPGGAIASGIRMIHSQPDRVGDDGAMGIVMATHEFVIFRSDVDAPEHQGVIVTGGVEYRINGDCLLDVEGLSWTCPAEEA